MKKKRIEWVVNVENSNGIGGWREECRSEAIRTARLVQNRDGGIAVVTREKEVICEGRIIASSSKICKIFGGFRK